MADKLTPLLADALTRAAAAPAGTPLFGTKSDPGLFPPTATAKPAAQKALADGLLTIVGTDTTGKQPRDLVAATDAGLRFLIDHVSPKQVLDDFVRVLERQEGQVTELLAAATRMADSLAGLKAVVGMVLPRVEVARIAMPTPVDQVLESRGANAEYQRDRDASPGGIGVPPVRSSTLEAPTMTLAEVVLARLTIWASTAAAGQDCPLPTLYRDLDAPPTIGAFHDCLRTLHAEGRIYLHPWTGPLYALPEPTFALLVGHNVAYYASPKR